MCSGCGGSDMVVLTSGVAERGGYVQWKGKRGGLVMDWMKELSNGVDAKNPLLHMIFLSSMHGWLIHKSVIPNSVLMAWMAARKS